MKKWYKLDNIGKFYAATSNNKDPKVFRFSVILKDNIDEVILQNALNQTVGIYRNFNVNLKKGIFWYYLDETSRINKVTKENLPVCFKLYNNSDDFLYRVSYYNKKINFEASHIISDGRGSLEFFKTLISFYIKMKYNLNIDISKNIASSSEISEDSFDKYYKKTKMSKSIKQKTYHYKGKKYRNQTIFMECHMNVDDVLKIAHKHKTTLTCMLVSILIYSFKDEIKISDMDKYIKIDVPVDLRNYFKSSSSMNFFGLTTITYKFNSKEDTIEDILKEVKKQFKEKINKEKLSERANLMVSFEKNWLCKIAPIFLKNFVIRNINKATVQNSTSSLSNVGIVDLDPIILDKIESVGVLISTSNFQFTICSLKNDLSIGISSVYANNDIIKNFCRYFTNNNIKLKIDVSEVK